MASCGSLGGLFGFQPKEGGSTPTLPLQFCDIGLDDALAFNAKHHSRLPSLGKNSLNAPRVFYGAFVGETLVGVAIWSNPVARAYNGKGYIELRRMALYGAPRHTASKMLGWMARDIAKRFPNLVRLLSYSDDTVHTGTIYRAAGWWSEAASAGGVWDCPSRRRARYATEEPVGRQRVPKTRWWKPLANKEEQ